MRMFFLAMCAVKVGSSDIILPARRAGAIQSAVDIQVRQHASSIITDTAESARDWGLRHALERWPAAAGFGGHSVGVHGVPKSLLLDLINKVSDDKAGSEGEGELEMIV